MKDLEARIADRKKRNQAERKEQSPKAKKGGKKADSSQDSAPQEGEQK